MLHEPGLVLTGTFFGKYKIGQGFQHLQSQVPLKKTNSRKKKAITCRKKKKANFQHLRISQPRGFEHHQANNMNLQERDHGRLVSLGWFYTVLPEMEGAAGHSMPESWQESHSQHPGFQGKSIASISNSSKHTFYQTTSSQPSQPSPLTRSSY